MKQTIWATRSIKKKEKTDDGRGWKTTVIGQEEIEIEVTVDSEKLFGQYGTFRDKIVNKGSNQATCLQKSIVAKVINRKALP